MSYSVEISEQADADLRGIFEYIAFELQSIQNAAGQLARLEKNILSLDRMPERFRRYGKEPWHSRGLHIMPVDHYCVFYIPDTEKSIVSIIRVMYGGRDIDAELAKHTET
jgi:toxin ParE1/3/4